MKNDVFSALLLYTNGLHESLARRPTIAGVHVDMFAPKTLWAVVGIAAPAYEETTPFAGEVFLCTLEFL